MSLPLDGLVKELWKTPLMRSFARIGREEAAIHLKDLIVDEVRPDRRMRIGDRWVVNFGSDSFLGLDTDPRVQAALLRGVRKWGTHNGTSRAFSSVRASEDAEEKLAKWLGIDAVLLHASVTLANHGAIPGLVSRHDVVVADQYAHNSIHEGVRLAAARGVRTGRFQHNSPTDLEQTLRSMRPYRHALVAVDGVYSMSGELPPLVDFRTVCLRNDAVLYVDDAHGTGVVGTQGRGTVRDALGDYENVIVAGSLSKGFSCMGGFVAGPKAAKELLKWRSNPLIFGGPVPPPYLEAICEVVDIVSSPEYTTLRARLDRNVRHLRDGAEALGFHVLGGLVPIVSIWIGDEDDTFHAGRYLFDRGFYTQSVIFPAVPHHNGVIRIQLNANHSPEAIEGLLSALSGLRDIFPHVVANSAWTEHRLPA